MPATYSFQDHQGYSQTWQEPCWHEDGSFCLSCSLSWLAQTHVVLRPSTHCEHAWLEFEPTLQCPVLSEKKPWCHIEPILTPSTSITCMSWSSMLTPKVAIPDTLMMRSLYVFPGLKWNVALTWSLIKPDSIRKKARSDKYQISSACYSLRGMGSTPSKLSSFMYCSRFVYESSWYQSKHHTHTHCKRGSVEGNNGFRLCKV